MQRTMVSSFSSMNMSKSFSVSLTTSEALATETTSASAAARKPAMMLVQRLVFPRARYRGAAGPGAAAMFRQAGPAESHALAASAECGAAAGMEAEAQATIVHSMRLVLVDLHVRTKHGWMAAPAFRLRAGCLQ